MVSTATNSYTPPPPERPSETSRSVLSTIEYPASATPLPPAPTTPSAGQSNAPQIRYCYFISANSASDSSNSRNPSLNRKAVYLAPYIQEPTDSSPNCTQPRSRPSKDANSSNTFVLGPRPPQIQLQFLEDEPLPEPSLDPQSLADLLPHDGTVTFRIETPDGALVERKDSGYGGSVTRSSSLATFGRNIRKVFWRNASKEEVEAVVVEDTTPVLECDIPQDVFDSSWADDLAHRLTLASAPDAVTAWLGQLPESAQYAHDANDYDSGSDMDMIEEVVFVVPLSPGLPRSVSEMSINKVQDHRFDASAPTQPAGKSLRRVLSVEELNKPQPPLPFEALQNKPTPSVPTQSRSTIGGTSPFNSLARKLNVGEFGFGKHAPTKSRRPNVHDIFQEPSDGMLSPSRPLRDARLSGESIEVLDGPSSRPETPGTSGMLTPDEMEGANYMSAKPTTKRANRFFKSLTLLTAADLKGRQQYDARQSSEVMFPNAETNSQESAPQTPTSPLRGKERSCSYPLAPPRPLFYNKGVSSSVSSLGQVSSCGSLASSAIDSSADEWDGHAQMTAHVREQNDRYNADLSDLQAMLYQANSSNRTAFTPSHSANTSTGSLSLTLTQFTSDKKETKVAKPLAKKNDYMSHRMSFSPASPVGKTKAKKSRLSMPLYGGGEMEVVKQAKFDTPQAIARNKEIRKFISQEIYTTELNYLQYLRTIDEVRDDFLIARVTC
ncbi:MAG: hypothetical protein J3Q66DRAFT_21768 [Benniella sp.]|nr:MAG: hypothetical protein J3Q66DRAFT_21768 [Benniella sp.]